MTDIPSDTPTEDEDESVVDQAADLIARTLSEAGLLREDEPAADDDTGD